MVEVTTSAVSKGPRIKLSLNEFQKEIENVQEVSLRNFCQILPIKMIVNYLFTHFDHRGRCSLDVIYLLKCHPFRVIRQLHFVHEYSN